MNTQKTKHTYDSHVLPRENVMYEKRHCAVCASGAQCPQKGTFHGESVALFQENRLLKFLLKKGIVSPYVLKIPLLFGVWGMQKRVSNLVTSAGKALIAGRINGSGSPAAATYIAVGTGTTAANVADTALQTETSTSGLARVNATVSLVTTSVTNDTAQIQTTFSVSGTVAVTESGVLNASSVGTLLTHQVFSAINVVNGDSLQVTWKVQAS